jgi:hypothetical protein
MHRDATQFADLLESAAQTIETSTKHPGQDVPGLWNLGGANTPERVIGVLAASALAKVARQRGVDLDPVLISYVEVSRNVSLTMRGAPDRIAAQHMRDAAAELRRGAGA